MILQKIKEQLEVFIVGVIITALVLCGIYVNNKLNDIENLAIQNAGRIDINATSAQTIVDFINDNTRPTTAVVTPVEEGE